MKYVYKMSAVLPVARLVLPFLGRAVASGAIGLGASSLLGKIFDAKIKRRNRRTKFKRKAKILAYRRYRRYVK